MARIGIDIRKLEDFGIGSYIMSLITGLPLKAPQHQYVLFHKPDACLEGLPAESVFSPENSGLYSPKELFSLSANASSQKVDLLHCPHYVTPYGGRYKLAVTIHDLIHLLFPEYLSGLAQKLYARQMMRKAVKSAAVIFTDSQRSKNDILEHLPVKEEKIVVTPMAVDPCFSSPPKKEERKTILEKLNIKGPYCLYLGNNKAHKNLTKAVKAFKIFRNNVGREWNFVLAGGCFSDPDSGAQLLSLVEKEQLSDCILFPGYLEKRDLTAVLAEAGIFVFPSLYEGFGLPPVEAMAAGVPVVSSNLSAMPEVLGDAALLTDPRDEVLLAHEMIRVVEDEELRNELIIKGRKKASEYNWQTMVEKTIEGYRKALES